MSPSDRARKEAKKALKLYKFQYKDTEVNLNYKIIIFRYECYLKDNI